MQNCGAAPKAQASRGWFRIASCVLSIAWGSRVSLLVAFRSLLVARKMGRKGVTVQVYSQTFKFVQKCSKMFKKNTENI